MGDDDFGSVDDLSGGADNFWGFGGYACYIFFFLPISIPTSSCFPNSMFALILSALTTTPPRVFGHIRVLAYLSA
jgi:hypothetical protein